MNAPKCFYCNPVNNLEPAINRVPRPGLIPYRGLLIPARTASHRPLSPNLPPIDSIKHNEGKTLLIVDPDNNRAQVRTYPKNSLRQCDAPPAAPDTFLEMRRFAVKHRCYVKVTMNMAFENEDAALRTRDQYARKMRDWLRRRSMVSRYFIAVDRDTSGMPCGIVSYLAEMHDWTSHWHLQTISGLYTSSCVHHLGSTVRLESDLQSLGENSAKAVEGRFFIATQSHEMNWPIFEVDTINEAVDIVTKHFARPHSLSRWNVVSSGAMKRAHFTYAPARREWY